VGIATPPCKLVPSQIMYTGSSAASPTPRLACVHSCKIKGYLYVYIHTVYKHPFACVHSHRRGVRLEGRAGATRTVSERKLTFLSYQLTFLSSKLTFLSSKLTFLPGHAPSIPAVYPFSELQWKYRGQRRISRGNGKRSGYCRIHVPRQGLLLWNSRYTQPVM
jgi:hypothetical protein